MAQVKVYGRRGAWSRRRDVLSDAIHAALVGAWQLPETKRFQRFCRLDDDLEVVILESDRASWGIRGRSGDELDLTYRVEV